MHELIMAKSNVLMGQNKAFSRREIHRFNYRYLVLNSAEHVKPVVQT